MALTHLGGVRSHLWASAVAARPGPRLRALGSRGTFVSESLDGQEDALAAGLPFDDLSTNAALTLGTSTVEVPGVPGAYLEFYRQLVASLTEGAPLPVDAESAVAALEVIEAAFTSARTGQVVTL